jgi:aminoglycoside 3-N-acetyltransferase
MTEAELMAATPTPRTVPSLAADLRELGVTPGSLVLVHSSLRSLGWVCGGARAVIEALQAAVTEAGTLVMPTHSGDWSDPGVWRHPPVPPDWLDELRATMPTWDPRTTPTRGMGALPELFRTFPGVVRSPHPVTSFAAWGSSAHEVCGRHELDDALGEGSPLGRIYERDGHVLLLGVPFAVCTSCHLAEYRAPGGRRQRSAVPVQDGAQRRWVPYDDIVFDVPLGPVGEAYLPQAGDAARRGNVGSAEALLLRQRDVVDFTARWMAEHAR